MAFKFWIILLLLGIFLVSGCVSAPEQRTEPLPKTTYSIYIDDLPSTIPSYYRSSIEDAIGFWEKNGAANFTETADLSQADIRVQWIKEWGGETIGQTYGQRLIQIGVGDSLCLGKYQLYNYDSVVSIAEHELGHAIGLGHSNNTDAVMYPLNKWIVYEKDWDETTILGSGVSQIVPICTRQEAAQYTFEVTSDKPVNIALVANQIEAQKAGAGQGFSYFPSCSGEGVTFYKKTCSVLKGNYLVVTNPHIFENAQVRYSAKQTPWSQLA